MSEFSRYFSGVLDFAHIMQLALVSISIIWVLTPVKMTKRGVLKGGAEWLGVFAACVLFEAFFFGLSGLMRGFGGICFPLAILVVIILYAVFFCEFTPSLTLLMAGVLFSIITVVTVYLTQIAYMIHTDNNVALVSFVIIAINCLNFVSAILLRRFSLTKFRDVPSICSVLILICASAIVLDVFAGEFLRTLVYKDVSLTGAIRSYTTVFGLVLFVVLIASYFMIYFICKEHERLIETRIEKRLIEVDEEMVHITNKNLEDMREIRHDIKNSYSYMAALIEEGNTDALKKYLKEASDSLAVVSAIDCANHVISNILNTEKAKLEAAGYILTAELNVPAVLPIKDSDLCSILFNLIDNAMEACESAGKKGAEILVKITLRQEYLYVGVSNPVSEDADKDELLRLKTNKKGGEHGYGTKIVKRLAEKYNGYVIFSVENGMFIAEGMFDVMGKSV